MLGFSAGSALSTPRYLQALADERLVPPVLARQHARFQTPAAAIVTTSFATLALTFVLDFRNLVDLAVLAVLCQYLATSAALVRLARTAPKVVLGVVSLVVSVAFALGSKLEQFLALGGVLVLGILVALATRALQKTA
jgi:amino acid transporter